MEAPTRTWAEWAQSPFKSATAPAPSTGTADVAQTSVDGVGGRRKHRKTFKAGRKHRSKRRRTGRKTNRS